MATGRHGHVVARRSFAALTVHVVNAGGKRLDRGGKRFREIGPKRRGWRYRLRELLDENLLR